MAISVGLILNRRNESAVQCAEKAAEIFRRHGVDTFDPQAETRHEKPNLIMTFGGDGTLLIGARYALKYDAPLLGVNLGTVGFLTEEDPVHMEEDLETLMTNQFQMEERSLLRVLNTVTGET